MSRTTGRFWPAALREGCEETAIRPGDLCLTPQFLGAPVDIDVHDIAADPDKGEPAHRHFDFRFVFHLMAEQPPLMLQEKEVSGAQWLAFADVSSPTLRAKLLNAEAALGLDGQPEPVNVSVLIHDRSGRCLLHLRDLLDGIWEPGVFALLGGGREPGAAAWTTRHGGNSPRKPRG